MGDTGAATEVRVTLYFFLKNLATFFAHRYHYRYRFLLLSLGCHPLKGVTPHLFICPTSFLHYSLSICPQMFFFRVSPPWRVSPGAVPPVTPLNSYIFVNYGNQGIVTSLQQ